MSQIIIVGVGALGSHLVQFLRGIKHNITIVDYDRIERKNIASQFHSQSSVGKNKAIALQQLMQFLFTSKVGAIPYKLTSLNTIEILGNPNLVVDCLDNGESRKIVQDFVRKHEIPCLHGALAANGQFGCVSWDEFFKIDNDSSGAATCDNGDFLPFISIVASYLAYSVNHFLNTSKKVGFQITPVGSVMV